MQLPPEFDVNFTYNVFDKGGSPILMVENKIYDDAI